MDTRVIGTPAKVSRGLGFDWLAGGIAAILLCLVVLCQSIATPPTGTPVRKYVYDSTREVLLDGFVAGMEEMPYEHPARRPHRWGGYVRLTPASHDQYEYMYEDEPYQRVHSISGYDPDAQGIWQTIEICGYQLRRDLTPSHCNTLHRTKSGWHFEPNVEDKGLVREPTANEIASWSLELSKALVALQSVPHNPFFGEGS